jgi:hypothetical protein
MRPDFVLGRIKRASERFAINWDFTLELKSGDTVTGHTVTAKLARDGSDATGTFTTGATHTTTTVTVTILAGTAGESYDVVFTATTAQGNTYSHVVRVQVEA